MDPLNWTIVALLTEERLRGHRAEFQRPHPEVSASPARRPSIRSALASTFVRWGLRLDPGAGERLRTPRASGAAQRRSPADH